MLSIMIDAYERRDVTTADVVGAYLNARMKDFVIMKFQGPTVRRHGERCANAVRAITQGHLRMCYVSTALIRAFQQHSTEDGIRSESL